MEAVSNTKKALTVGPTPFIFFFGSRKLMRNEEDQSSFFMPERFSLMRAALPVSLRR